MEFLNISLKKGLEMAKEEDCILIDVREPYRYQEGHLPGAVNYPYGMVKEGEQKGKKMIVYCDFGGQSMMAARHLAKKGYKVYNIVGGVFYYMKEKKDS